MKHNYTLEFELNGEDENYAKQAYSVKNPENCLPNQQIINNVLNYAKALEVIIISKDNAYFSIMN